MSRARNKWLYFKNGLGRLQWFEPARGRENLGSRVNIYCRAPVSAGRVIQLLAQGFSWPGVISDLRVLQEMFKAVKLKGAHYVFSMGVKLPRPIVVDLFGPSNGVVAKLSDRSHPYGLELQVHYPDWAERNERLFQDLADFFKEFRGPGTVKIIDPKNPYWV